MSHFTDYSKFPIEKNIPIPKVETTPVLEEKLLSMNIGDSFKFPIKNMGSVRSKATKLSTKNKSYKFTVRTMAKKGEIVEARIWRIAGTGFEIYDKMPIKELFTRRVVTALSVNPVDEHKIFTLAELLNKSKRELLRYRGLGRNSIFQITDVLDAKGLHLKND